MADRKKLARTADFDKLRETGEYFPGCRLVLFPNGEREIWIQDGYNSFYIRCSRGPVGLNVTVGRHAGTVPITVTGNKDRAADYDPIPQFDADEVSLTQYACDEKSQAFKKWYGLHVSPGNEEEDTAFQNGKACASSGKNPEEWTSPPPTDPKIGNFWWAGYYYQRAGLD